MAYGKADCSTAVYDSYSISWLLNTWHLSIEDTIEVVARIRLLRLDQTTPHVQ